MISQKERWRRWQLAVGVEDEQNELSDRDRCLNAALSALYDSGTEKRSGGLGASSPRVAKWLGDIREFFPTPIVQIVQKDAFERLNLKAATRIFVVSEVERRNLLRAGIADEKIIVNANGVDTERFRPNIGGETTRAELGISNDEILAGFVGTFGPWHGVLTLAEAITLMPTDSKVRFLLVGAGRFRDEVESMIRAAGKEDRVIFTGHLEHERVPGMLDACDILLSPHVPLADGSEFFGSPTKLFEYMAMGKAIVASRLGQIGDVLTDEESGLLIEPGNAQQLADAILRLSQSPELRARLGAAARCAAVARHTWKQNAERVIDEYRALESEAPAAAGG